MADGFPNKPKILRGAFMEYGLSIPPLWVVFQFNPEQLTRSRSLSFSPPNQPRSSGSAASGQMQTESTASVSVGQQNSLWGFHQNEFAGQDDLLAIRDGQQVTFDEESISFDIRLDASEKLNDADPVTGLFGLSPQISSLESMVHSKSDTPFGAIADLLGGGDDEGYSFTGGERPPMVLFIWGRKRILPVNITSMNITETEFSTDLNTTRATVSVSLKVIEGKNLPYGYTAAVREVMTALNLANIADIANIVIPV